MKSKKIKVLLLEDDLDLQEVLTDYFTPRGYDFICHSSAEQGLNEVIRHSSNSESIDLVISDFCLPNMNGVELIERLHRSAPNIPIILITAHSSLELAVDAIEKGAYDFVVKPIQFPQLSISMERAIYFSNLRKENEKLKLTLENTPAEYSFLNAKSAVMQTMLGLTKRVAKCDSTVLISGESGTGKEVLARFIHQSSSRSEKPFIAINCSAIPETLLESELFGHARGSFTGAEEKKMGLFEEANEGTLFLDEIGDLSLPLQAKLLRVLQEWKIKRVGENTYRDINVRLLTATHKNLSLEVLEKRFREDLFFRLNVIPIQVPSLRERREDILALADYFLLKFKNKTGSKIQGFSKSALLYMLKYEWRGNVRELENSIERAVVLSDGPFIAESDFLFPKSTFSQLESVSENIDDRQISLLISAHDDEKRSHSKENDLLVTQTQDDNFVRASVQSDPISFHLLSKGELVSLETLEHRYIQYVLEQTSGIKDRAAKILKVDRKTLYRKLESISSLTPQAAI